MKFEQVGTMTFGETIDITDPCYSRDVWCRMNDVVIEPGEYDCYVCWNDCGTWGNRVKAIAISKNKQYIKVLRNLDELGVIGVDAGMAGFFNNKQDFSDSEWSEFCDKVGIDKLFFSPNNEFVCNGFFSASGYGDGSYPVLVHRNDDGIPNALMLKFL